jgi:acetylglutamate kinase
MDSVPLVIKVGGNEIDWEDFLAGLVAAVVEVRKGAAPVIVHGGGKEIACWQERLGLVTRFVEGLRVTDGESLAVAEMVLSGLVNKRLVARLVAARVPAVGLSGVDWGLIRVEKMVHPAGDLGQVGRIVGVHPEGLEALMHQGVVPVISPISLGLDGQTYNVNADHAALAVAAAMGADSLVFLTNVPGVLIDDQPAPHLTVPEAKDLIASGIIVGGMIPKVRSALEAVAAGVSRAVITDLDGLREGTGTAIVAD